MVSDKERIPIIEVGREPEIAPETGLEKLEKEQYILKKPVLDDQTGQVLVTAPSAQQPVIVLPLTEEELQDALKVKVENSIRWLAEWSRRLAKILGGKARFKKSQEVLNV